MDQIMKIMQLLAIAIGLKPREVVDKLQDALNLIRIDLKDEDASKDFSIMSQVFTIQKLIERDGLDKVKESLLKDAIDSLMRSPDKEENKDEHHPDCHSHSSHLN